MSEEHAVVFVGWLVHATGAPNAGPVKQTSLIMLRLAFATFIGR
jgi:hypothetical protein